MSVSLRFSVVQWAISKYRILKVKQLSHNIFVKHHVHTHAYKCFESYVIVPFVRFFFIVIDSKTRHPVFYSVLNTPPRILSVKDCRFLQKCSPNCLSVGWECAILIGREGKKRWTEKWRDEGWQRSCSCLGPRLVPAHCFPLMTRGPEFLRIPWDNSCCHPQLFCSLWRGRGSSWAGYSPAKQSSNSGMGTDSLVVPAGWLSLLKPYPANYSLRMPSWLSNGESGDHPLLGPLTGLSVLTGKQ